jgi:cytochrome b561
MPAWRPRDIGVFVFLPHLIEPGTGEDAPRGEHSGHHRVLLVVVFVHAVAAEEVQVTMRHDVLVGPWRTTQASTMSSAQS